MSALKAVVLSLCIGVIGLAATPNVALAKTYRSNPQHALDVCIQSALRKLMMYRETVSQTDVKDRHRRLLSNEVLMSVKVFGKRTNVLCIYDYATGKAAIQAPRAVEKPLPVTPLPGDALAKESLRACTRAAQGQQLLVDNLVSQEDIHNNRREVIGSLVTLNVYQAGRAAKLVCDYDYVAKRVGLQLVRP